MAAPILLMFFEFGADRRETAGSVTFTHVRRRESEHEEDHHERRRTRHRRVDAAGEMTVLYDSTVRTFSMPANATFRRGSTTCSLRESANTPFPFLM